MAVLLPEPESPVTTTRRRPSVMLIWGPVQCSGAARPARFRCPQTPSACPSALALGLHSWGPVQGGGLPPGASSGGISHVDRAEERIERHAQAVLSSIEPARDDHLGAARAPVREEEYLHHPVAEGLAALDVLDDGAVGEHRPAAPARRVDAVLKGVDDQLLRLAEGHRLAPAVVHGSGDLARRAAHLAPLVAALDHGHDERAPDGDDDEHHHHLEEREGKLTPAPVRCSRAARAPRPTPARLCRAPRTNSRAAPAARGSAPRGSGLPRAVARNHPVSPSQLVTSRLSPSPPGPPSAP